MPAYAPLYPDIYASDFMMHRGMHLHMHLHRKIDRKYNQKVVTISLVRELMMYRQENNWDLMKRYIFCTVLSPSAVTMIGLTLELYLYNNKYYD